MLLLQGKAFGITKWLLSVAPYGIAGCPTSPFNDYSPSFVCTEKKTGNVVMHALQDLNVHFLKDQVSLRLRMAFDITDLHIERSTSSNGYAH